jgi:hypothetical protein
MTAHAMVVEIAVEIVEIAAAMATAIATAGPTDPAPIATRQKSRAFPGAAFL